MQISSIDSLSPYSSANATSDPSISLPLIGNIANIDATPQTAICVQDTAIASTSNSAILLQLQGIEQSSQALSEESQLISILKNLSKLEDLYHDENLSKLLIKNDDPRKYCYVELFASALYAQAAWYRLKNRVSDLLYFIPLERNYNISQEKKGFAIAITNLINNKIKHQKCLDKIQSKNFDTLLDSTDSTIGKKTNEELTHEIKKVKKLLGEYRRVYCDSILLCGIEENTIIENLPQYLAKNYSVEAIKNIFVSLPKEKIKQLILSHVSLSFSSTDKMEEHAFKIKRKPVPESFWYSLGKCSVHDRKAFNKHFFLFLLSSWLSESERLLWQKRELKEAIITNNTVEECKILADKLLQLAFRIGAKRVFRQIIDFAKEYERLISSDSDDTVRKESTLIKLNATYSCIFTEIHQPYVESKRINWNLKTPEECQAQINLLKTKIGNAYALKKRLSIEVTSDLRKFLDFIYSVLLHFRDNDAIQLADLNDIANRTIKLTTQQIQDQETSTVNEQSQTSISGAAAQSLKRKRKEKHQQIEEQCDPWESAIASKIHQ